MNEQDPDIDEDVTEASQEVKNGTAGGAAITSILIDPVQPAPPGATQSICTGIVLGYRLILTAAHCVEGHYPTDIHVGTLVADSYIIRAPSTLPRSTNNALSTDMAVVHLSNDYPYPGFVGPIQIAVPSYAAHPGGNQTLAGVGLQSNTDAPGDANSGTITYLGLTYRTGQPAIAPLIGVYGAGPTGQTSCGGDSGGAVYVPSSTTLLGVNVASNSATCSSVTQSYTAPMAGNRYWFEATVRRLSSSPTNNPNGMFVRSLYENLLRRQPAAADENPWITQLSSGASRTQVATNILGSTEHATRLAERYYQNHLRRTASSSEASSWAAQIVSTSQESVQAQILASAEYFTLSGSTNTGFVNRVYSDVVRAVPSTAALNNWTNVAATQGRLAAAQGILASAEARDVFLADWCFYYLGRSINYQTDQAWINSLAGGSGHRAVQAAILGSAEYNTRYAY